MAPELIIAAMLVPAKVASAAAASPTLWYLTRTAAVAAYIALALTAAVGIVRSIARQSGERASWVIDEIHQFVAALAAVLVAAHLITLIFDPFLTFAVKNIFIPGNQPYRPLAVNVGVFGMYALVIVLASSWVRRSLSYAFWRALHYLSFIAFVLVTAHGWLAGSDAKEPWMLAIYGGCTAAIGFLIILRIFIHGPARNAGMQRI